MSEGFLGRWSRRKNEAKAQTQEVDSEKGLLPLVDEQSSGLKGSNPDKGSDVELAGGPRVQPDPQTMKPELPVPTEEDLARIGDTADIASFMQAKVPLALKNQAFKELFKIPKFNHVDMLDVYMEDYNTFIPLTEEMRDKMTFSKSLLSRPDLEEAASNALMGSGKASDAKVQVKGVESSGDSGLADQTSDQTSDPTEPEVAFNEGSSAELEEPALSGAGENRLPTLHGQEEIKLEPLQREELGVSPLEGSSNSLKSKD